MRARHLRTNRVAQLAWSHQQTNDLAVRTRGLAEDLEGMLAVIVGDRGLDAALDPVALPDLEGWLCSSCGSPMITPRAPSTIQNLECPMCTGRRSTAELGRIAHAIGLTEARITQTIAKEPAIPTQTQVELGKATAELRQLKHDISDVGGGHAGSDGGGRSGRDHALRL
jgi:hypothetical protein